MATQGERLAVVESRIEKIDKDMDSLFEGQRKINDTVTRIDEHLSNGLTARISKNVTENLSKEREERDRKAQQMIAIWGVVLVAVQILAFVVIEILTT